jgi:F-box-like
MPLQRQTCLRVSAQRVLRTEPPPPLPPKESITSSLPDEILMEIFTYLTPKNFADYDPAYEPYLPLTLVCKRWRCIYEPFLYRILDLNFHGWQNPHRVGQLWENLENRPNLRGNTRAFRIFFHNPNWHACNNIARSWRIARLYVRLACTRQRTSPTMSRLCLTLSGIYLVSKRYICHFCLSGPSSGDLTCRISKPYTYHAVALVGGATLAHHGLWMVQ